MPVMPYLFIKKLFCSTCTCLLTKKENVQTFKHLGTAHFFEIYEEINPKLMVARLPKRT